MSNESMAYILMQAESKRALHLFFEAAAAFRRMGLNDTNCHSSFNLSYLTMTGMRQKYAACNCAPGINKAAKSGQKTQDTWMVELGFR